MKKWSLVLFGIWALFCPAFAQQEAEAPASADAVKPTKVIIIPIREQIAKPELYILRRGLKQAINEGADTVILDMNTPGGSVAVTLKMLEALDRFPGRKITYVNDEAMSAGAIIAAVTDEIHFAPKATIGAAEMIMGTGQDVSEGLKRKMNSYMGAKIRAFTGEKPLRAQVIRAMMDPEYEFKIGDEIIKPKGELLSLTAYEAIKTYGDPPQQLLGVGISKSLDELVASLHGSATVVQHLEITWSEKAAQYLTAITPLLVGIGMLGLFIEFKTPGFGIFGIAGLSLLAIVFLGQYVVGLSGHEPLLFFLLGVALIAVELIFFPGTLVAALTGAALMLGSLVWAMMDHWPDQPIPISGAELSIPLMKVTSGFLIALVLFFLLLKFLPKNSRFGGFVLDAAIAAVPAAAGTPILGSATTPHGRQLIGTTGHAATGLFPSGQVEIGGYRYEAKLKLGFADPGTPVRVTDATDFELIVEVLS
jgi:membrane-bound serine protease (ClpP class)